MQNKLTNGKLLDNKGNLIQAGYSTELKREYDRSKIKASKFKIKEWDYYLIYNKNFAVALTVADNSYMGMLSASLIDFENKKEITKSIIEPFTFGKYNLPQTSKKGDIFVSNGKAEFSFEVFKDRRVLKVNYPNFDGEKTLQCNFELTDEPHESMVIATPFKENKKAFYYNQKIVGFCVDGSCLLGETKIDFNKNDSFAILDWGRGVWTYKNTWYWSSLAGKTDDGHRIGFNLGYGFGDTSKASENMLFYDGYATKIDDIEFVISKNGNKYDYLSPWRIVSSDKKVDLLFKPILNRHSDTNVLVLRSNQNQVFGLFSGKLTFEDNRVVEIKDMLGFAERVFNKW